MFTFDLFKRHGDSTSSRKRKHDWSTVIATIELLESRQVLAATLVTGAWTGGVFDHVALYENGIWQLDSNGNGIVGDDSAPFQYGIPGDLPVAGDWNGNGIASVGVYRVDASGLGWFVLDADDNRIYTSADITTRYGLAGDVPVAGNWNGFSGDEIGVFRFGGWALDRSGNFVWGSGDVSFGFGLFGDIPVVGNWDVGNSRDSVGVSRTDIFGNRVFSLDRNENYFWDGALRDLDFRYGRGVDLPFAGDFSGDNTDEVGVVTLVFGVPQLSITPINIFIPTTTRASAFSGLSDEVIIVDAAAQSRPSSSSQMQAAPAGTSDAAFLPVTLDLRSDERDASLDLDGVWLLDRNGLEAELLA